MSCSMYAEGDVTPLIDAVELTVDAGGRVMTGVWSGLCLPWVCLGLWHPWLKKIPLSFLNLSSNTYLIYSTVFSDVRAACMCVCVCIPKRGTDHFKECDSESPVGSLLTLW